MIDIVGELDRIEYFKRAGVNETAAMSRSTIRQRTI